MLKGGGSEKVSLSEVPVENLIGQLEEGWEELIFVGVVRVVSEHLDTQVKNLQQLLSLKQSEKWLYCM